jgi:hypothetical protein
LKKALISTPVIQPPDWHLPFEIMCDASDYAVGAVLGQSKDKKQYAISYASKTLTGPQLNYATIEKELLAVVFAIEKFMSYLVGAKVIVDMNGGSRSSVRQGNYRFGGDVTQNDPASNQHDSNPAIAAPLLWLSTMRYTIDLATRAFPCL